MNKFKKITETITAKLKRMLVDEVTLPQPTV